MVTHGVDVWVEFRQIENGQRPDVALVTSNELGWWWDKRKGGYRSERHARFLHRRSNYQYKELDTTC